MKKRTMNGKMRGEGMRFAKTRKESENRKERERERERERGVD